MDTNVNSNNNGSLQGTIGKLEDMFDILNEEFYDNQLERPIISVHPDTMKALGWCSTYHAWVDADGKHGYYEINICADYLNRPFSEIAETMMHEMVHLFNLSIGVKDCSNHGRYHNAKFRNACEEHGLNAEKDGSFGYAVTSLNDSAKEFIDTIDMKFDLYRPKIAKKKAASPKMHKYVCPICGQTVRSTKPVHICCADCDEIMEEEE